MPEHARNSSVLSGAHGRRIILVTSIALVLVLIGVLVAGQLTRKLPVSSKANHSTSTRLLARGSRHHAPVTTVHLGPVGVVSSAMIAENRRPGTAAWQIPAGIAPGGIEGFASLDSASV